MSWGKKSKKKPSVLTNFHFLVNFIRHTGPMVTMVTSCTVTLFQLPVVEMNWGKNLRKNLMIWRTFISWSISSDTLVAWSPQKQKKNLRVNKVLSSSADRWQEAELLSVSSHSLCLGSGQLPIQNHSSPMSNVHFPLFPFPISNLPSSPTSVLSCFQCPISNFYAQRLLMEQFPLSSISVRAWLWRAPSRYHLILYF